MDLDELIATMWSALADADLADRVHRDPSFRAAAQADHDGTMRMFEVTTLASGRTARDRRQPSRVRLDAARRPIL